MLPPGSVFYIYVMIPKPTAMASAATVTPVMMAKDADLSWRKLWKSPRCDVLLIIVRLLPMVRDPMQETCRLQSKGTSIAERPVKLL